MADGVSVVIDSVAAMAPTVLRWAPLMATLAVVVVGFWALAALGRRDRAVDGVSLWVRFPPLRAPGARRDAPSMDSVMKMAASSPWPLAFELVAQPDRRVQSRVWAPCDAVPYVASALKGAVPGCELAPAPDAAVDGARLWRGVVDLTFSSWWAPLTTDRVALAALVEALSRVAGVDYALASLCVDPRPSWLAGLRSWRIRRLARQVKRADRPEKSDVGKFSAALLAAPSLRIAVRLIAAGADGAAVERELSRLSEACGYFFRSRMAWTTQELHVRRVTILPPDDDPTARRPATAADRRMVALIGVLLALHAVVLALWPTWSWTTALVALGAAGGALRRRRRDPARIWRQAVNRRHDVGATCVSSAEAALLWVDPSDDAPMLARLPNRRFPAPLPAFEAAAAPHGVALALAERADGALAPVGTTLDDMRRIVHLTAGMGAGKSRLLANVVHQLMRRPIGLCVIDGKGDDHGSLAWFALDLAPMEREKDLVWINPLDSRWPVALNPLHPGGADSAEVANQLLAMLSRLDAGGWARAHGMEQLAMHAGILIAEAEEHPTLALVKRALLDDGYRASLLPRVRNPETAVFWSEVYPSGAKAMRLSRDALVRRIDKVLVPDQVRWMFTSPRPSVRFTELMEQSAIVLAPIPSEQLGGVAYAVAVLLVRAIVAAAFRRAGSDRERSNWPLIVDEVQVLADQTGGNADFQTMLTRLRSLGVPALYAHQTLSQLGSAVDDMLVNAANRVLLRTPPPDAEVYARRYSSAGLSAADIANQEPERHQYLDLMCDGVPTGVFSARPLPWPTPDVPQLDAWTGPPWESVRAAPPVTPAMRRVDAWVEDVMALQRTLPPDVLAQCRLRAERWSDAEWRDVQARWLEHRMAQRAFLLEHPEAEPHHRTRRIMISSLAYGRPVVDAMIEYLRLFRAEPAERAAAPILDGNLFNGVVH